MHTGNCLCGGIQFELLGDIAPVQLCHCQQCRKAQGTPFASNVPVAEPDFRITSGKLLVKEFESSLGKVRAFCSNCGSPILSKKDSLPGVVRIRAGLINEDIPPAIAWNAFVANKANWWPISGTQLSAIKSFNQLPESYETNDQETF